MSKQNNVWIFHHDDADGYACAALVGALYTHINHNFFDKVTLPDNVHFIPVDYKKTIGFLGEFRNKRTGAVEYIEKEDTVWLLDYSTSRDDDLKDIDQLYERFGEDFNFIWIDHHKTSKISLANSKGLRAFLKKRGAIFVTEEYNQAACMLVYTMIGCILSSSRDRELIKNDTISEGAIEYAVSIISKIYSKSLTKQNDEGIKEFRDLFENLETTAPKWIQYTADHDIYAERHKESHIFHIGVANDSLYEVYLNYRKPVSFISRMTQYIHAFLNDSGLSHILSMMDNRAQEYYNRGFEIKKTIDTQNKKRLYDSFEIEVQIEVSKEVIDPTDEMKFEYGEDGKTHVHGKLLCLNNFGNSGIFLDKFEEYDAVVAYVHNGECVIYSIFSKSSSTFKCNLLALWGKTYYGITGGGHDHAAGFSAPALIFWKDRKYLLRDREYLVSD